jgi:hypothetical protein
VRNLTEPSREGVRVTLTKALSQYKHGGKLCGYQGTDAEIDEVVSVYDAYDAAQGVAAVVLTAPTMGGNLKLALHDAYDQTQKNRRLKGVRELLFAAVELCPVCGIDPPTELDHVLPRAVYQALAIYVRNLVPLCHLCNHRKLAGFAEPGEMGFVHAYYDLLPNVQFLCADINLNGATLSVGFSIDETNAALGNLGARLTNIHLRLGLNDRYRAEVNIYLAGQAIALHGAHAANGPAGVRTHLLMQARYEVGRFYRNHWRPTLLFALAEHAGFCDGGFVSVFAVPADIVADALGL